MVTFEALLRDLRGKTPEIEPTQLAAALRENGKRPAVIDVREPDENATGMIPGTLHIPRGFLELRIERSVPDRSSPVHLTRSSVGAFARYSASEVISMSYSSWMALASATTRPSQG